MKTPPFFAIVLAAYNRGHHILPTIASVLQQSFPDFELIVVGDGCNDATADAVRSFGDARISWQNLERNTGSQSTPNNVGIRNTSAPWVCYIGHDDIWAPNHLDRLRGIIKADDASDFVVSGCIYHGPQDSGVYFVTGIFESSDVAMKHFFPPSSFAHRRDVTQQIGEWRDPRALNAPVDCEFLLRAVHAGLRFVSTGAVTVHKFAAGHRYLSYLRQSSAEQCDMLAKLKAADDGYVDLLVERLKQSGLFMGMPYLDFSAYANGALFERNRQNKGLSRAVLRPLSECTRVVQGEEARGLDWYEREGRASYFRWSGPNPRPKILIPFAGGDARITLDVVAMAPQAELAEVAVSVEESQVDCSVAMNKTRRGRLIFPARLKQSEETIVTLHTPRMFCPHAVVGNGDRRTLGIAVADMVIEPL
jgi:glycosyltransferase involved in cell wall biosynthesis